MAAHICERCARDAEDPTYHPGRAVRAIQAMKREAINSLIGRLRPFLHDSERPPLFGVCFLGKKEAAMMGDKKGMMTGEQREELKRLCDAAGVPDKSGEEVTYAFAQQMIEEMRQQLKERS